MCVINPPVNLLLLHALAIGLYSFDANFRLVREEDEQLIGRIVIMSYQNNEIAPSRSLLARLVAELIFKLLQCLIQFILRYEITSIVTQLHYRFPDAPQFICLILVVHINVEITSNNLREIGDKKEKSARSYNRYKCNRFVNTLIFCNEFE